MKTISEQFDDLCAGHPSTPEEQQKIKDVFFLGAIEAVKWMQGGHASSLIDQLNAWAEGFEARGMRMRSPAAEHPGESA
jgi:hypothetical protein